MESPLTDKPGTIVALLEWEQCALNRFVLVSISILDANLVECATLVEENAPSVHDPKASADRVSSDYSESLLARSICGLPGRRYGSTRFTTLPIAFCSAGVDTWPADSCSRCLHTLARKIQSNVASAPFVTTGRAILDMSCFSSAASIHLYGATSRLGPPGLASVDKRLHTQAHENQTDQDHHFARDSQDGFVEDRTSCLMLY